MSIEVQDLSFGYQTGSYLLQNISFSAAKGEVICLLGPNGTGKTTLLRCLLGLYQPQQGCVLINGRNAKTMTQKEKFRCMAYVPQSGSTAFAYTVYDLVFMGRHPYLSYFSNPSKQDQLATLKALEQLNISGLADRYFDELSGGERQMVLIARALAQEAEVLIMDEPTSALDYGNQVKLLKLIQALARAGYTIIMSSHYPSHAFLLANKVLMIKNGKLLAAGYPDEVVTEENLSDLYSTEIKVAKIFDEQREVKLCFPLLEDASLSKLSMNRQDYGN